MHNKAMNFAPVGAGQRALRLPGGAFVLGQVIKNIVVYPHAWWRETGLSGSAVTPDAPVSFVVDSSDETGQPGTLVALATGPGATALRRMDVATRKATVLSHIRRVLGGTSAHPTEFLSTDWMSEMWSRGGYASRRTIGHWSQQRDLLTAPYGPLKQIHGHPQQERYLKKP